MKWIPLRHGCRSGGSESSSNVVLGGEPLMSRRIHLTSVAVAFAIACGSSPIVPSTQPTGVSAPEFLRTAEIEGRLEKEFDSVAFTDPIRVTLTSNVATGRAIFKDVDTVHMKHTFGDGRTLTNVKDSYKHEIAAFELDQLLGLDIVPPCVDRTIHGRRGSLCLWIEHAMTESDRIKRGIQPPNAVDFNNQMHVIRLFHQLVWDPDYNNVRNLLVDQEFKLYKIDSSMAFRPDPELRKEASLTRFSKTALASLEALDRNTMALGLGRWLDEEEIGALWARRCRILDLADERVEERGVEAVLY
jgi:hypothetical protein